MVLFLRIHNETGFPTWCGGHCLRFSPFGYGANETIIAQKVSLLVLGVLG